MPDVVHAQTLPTPRPRRTGVRTLALALASLSALAFLACQLWDHSPARSVVASDVPYASDGSPVRRLPKPTRRPNVVLILLDTLRGDALEGSADSPPSMPRLRARADRGVRFPRATAPAPWTVPSVTSLLTGVIPSTHGATGDRGPGNIGVARTTFAEILRSSYGYATAAFLGTNLGSGPASALAGFDSVVPGFTLAGTDELLSDWAGLRDQDRPFLLLLHTYDPHHPYGAANHPFPPLDLASEPEGLDPIAALGAVPEAEVLVELLLTDFTAARFLTRRHPGHMADLVVPYLWRGLRDRPNPDLCARLEAAYSQGAAWVDEQLDRAWGTLERLGLLSDTLVVVTSDHGEAFGEHGLLMHGRQLYDELVRVPLVLTGPAPFAVPREVNACVGLIDLFPTLLEWIGAPSLPNIDGRSFLPLLGPAPSVPAPAARVVESEEWIRPHRVGEEVDHYLAAACDGRWKVIGTRDLSSREVWEEAYDLQADPGERAPLARSRAETDALPLGPELRAAVLRLRGRLDAAEGRERRRVGAAQGR